MKLTDFIKEARLIHGDKYDYSKVNFKYKSDEVIIIYDNIEYTQRVYKHLKGKSPEKVNRRKTTKEFIEESINIWGYKYDYSLTEYINAKTDVAIIYNNEIFYQKPHNHLRGHKCELDNTIKTTKDFIEKAISIHGNKYDYSLVEYTNMNDDIKIIYDDIIYTQKAYDHIYVKTPVYKVNKRCYSDYLTDFNHIYKGLYKFDNVNYKNSITKYKIICKIHGEFERTFAMLSKGYGCNKCNYTIKCKEIEKYLNKNKVNYNRLHKFDSTSPIYDFYIPSIRTVFNIKDDNTDIYDYNIYREEYCEDNIIDFIDIRLEDDISKLLYKI